MATKTANARLSTYSTAPTLAPSFAPSRLSTVSKVSDTSCVSAKSEATVNTTATTNPKHIDISVWHRSFEKLRDERLEQQRFYITELKKDEQGKLALGAKLERALSRRMTGQDAVRRDRKSSLVPLCQS